MTGSVAREEYSAVLEPAGFHPVLALSISLPSTSTSTHPSCSLWTYAAISSAFIADQYQLAQLHNEGHLGSPSSSSSARTLQVFGDTDLEAPRSKAEETSILIRLRATGSEKGKERALEEFRIPFHVRYQDPVAQRWDANGVRQDVVNITMDWPLVFWACDTQVEGKESTPCGLSTLSPLLNASFSPTTNFYSLTPSPLSAVTCQPYLLPRETISIPTGVSSDLPVVEVINFVAVWLGALWVAWKAFEAKKRWKPKRRGEKKDN